jgi:uncharacterized membrane protein YphA (DoxX/SURF4 family)
MNALLYKGNRAAEWLGQRSVDILRVSLGLIFLVFGVLKFFPRASPAEALVMRTIDTLTLGVVHGRSAVLLTAVMECFIGLTLVSGRLLRTGLLVLGFSLVGIMSPLVLFFGDLFPGTPTLEAQYVLKDVVLAAAGLVVAAKALTATPVRIGDRAGLMPRSGAVRRLCRLRRGRGARRFRQVRDELVHLTAGADHRQVVDVVPGLHDQPVPHPQHEDPRHPERLAGRHDRPGVLELGHDHLGVGGLVHPDVVRLEAHHLGDLRADPAEVLAERVPAEQRVVAVRVHRVPDVGLLGVQLRQHGEVAIGDAVREFQEDLFRSHRIPHGYKRSGDFEYMESRLRLQPRRESRRLLG